MHRFLARRQGFPCADEACVLALAGARGRTGHPVALRWLPLVWPSRLPPCHSPSPVVASRSRPIGAHGQTWCSSGRAASSPSPRPRRSRRGAGAARSLAGPLASFLSWDSSFVCPSSVPPADHGPESAPRARRRVVMIRQEIPWSSTPGRRARAHRPSVRGCQTAESRSVLVVSHHLDGFLRPRVPGMLQPGPGPGVRRVSPARFVPLSGVAAVRP